MSTGATDGMYTRSAGIPTYGVSGLDENPEDVRAHGRDERVGIESFYKATQFWFQLGEDVRRGSMKHEIFSAAPLVVVILLSAVVFSQQAPVGYDDTPMQPNGKWRVHDGKRPQPPIVSPRVTNENPVPPPSDAHRAARQR